jgi:hypothetical protein
MLSSKGDGSAMQHSVGATRLISAPLRDAILKILKISMSSPTAQTWILYVEVASAT